ncbi:glycosyltransferase family 39 protein [bacterium]|nr:glycosyltransferase family 39 protein [bacterium]
MSVGSEARAAGDADRDRVEVAGSRGLAPPGDRAAPASSAPSREDLVAALATVAALLPFLGKAFHVDDPLFLWLARRVSTHPLDPFGFDVNWYGANAPMWRITQNPPLGGFMIAAAAAVVGWSERALHGVFLLPAAVAIAATARLARRCGAPGLLAALAALLTPVFLVSATTLMCDVPMLALWLTATLAWMRGIDRDSGAWLAAAAGLATAAVLTKYFAVTLVPLLAAWACLRARRLDPRVAWLLLPLAALGCWDRWTAAVYGRPLLLGAVDYAGGAPSPFGARGSIGVGIAFAGGCLASWIGLLPLACSRRALAGWGALAAVVFVAVASAGQVGEYRFPAAGLSRWAFVAEASAFLVGGLLLVGLGLDELSRRRDADSILLVAWMLGTLVFAAVVNWTANGRSVLPLVPPAAILLARRVAERGRAGTGSVADAAASARLATALGAAAALSLAVAAADQRVAEAGRAGARAALARADGHDLWFQGHWGLQWYLEEGGARAIDFDRSPIRPGDRIAIPSYNTNVRPLPEDLVRQVEVVPIAPSAILTTMHEAVGAGFYAAIATGPLPFGFGEVPPDEIRVVEAVRP